MAPLPNARHERFAQGLANGKTADEAYQEAGFKPNRGNATRLKANESIQDRVKELTDRVAQGVVLSRQWIIEQLMENAALAKQAGDIAPSNRALELLGKHIRMFDGKDEGDDDTAPALSININVRDAVSDVRVTKPE